MLQYVKIGKNQLYFYQTQHILVVISLPMQQRFKMLGIRILLWRKTESVQAIHVRTSKKGLLLLSTLGLKTNYSYTFVSDQCVYYNMLINKLIKKYFIDIALLKAWSAYNLFG